MRMRTLLLLAVLLADSVSSFSPPRSLPNVRRYSDIIPTRTGETIAGRRYTISALSLVLDNTLLPSSVLDAATTITTTNGNLLVMDKATAEAIAGPFFGLSLLPYLAFLYFLNKTNDCPKGVVVGFAACLVFVFLTIPAAILAQVWYSVSLADCDWLHGSAESLLTITNLCTVLPFRQALQAKETNTIMPITATTYRPMVQAVVGLSALAVMSAVIPAVSGGGATVHTPYILDQFLPTVPFLPPEPDNSLTVATWVIHVSSLVEFLVAMGFCWKWAGVTGQERYKGLTWGLLPLHSSGITACVSHVFYNRVAVLVPLQAFLTCLGNCTAAYAAWRIVQAEEAAKTAVSTDDNDNNSAEELETSFAAPLSEPERGLVGFEDLGEALAEDTDFSFVGKLFLGCILFSYAIKYVEGTIGFDPSSDAIALAILWVGVPSALNAYKWKRRSDDASFEGWF